jgi:hemerythrin superfamily protein
MRRAWADGVAHRAAIPRMEGEAMDAIGLLKEDHEKVRKLFKQLDKATGPRRDELFATLTRELELHTTVEERYLYPVMDRVKSAHELVQESYQEHHQVDVVIAEMQGLQPDGDAWQAKLAVLREDVEHHADEEEKELFPAVRKELGKRELEEMGRGIEQMKAQAQARR